MPMVLGGLKLVLPVLFCFLTVDYFLEQFQVYRKIEWEVWRVPLYYLPPMSPISNIFRWGGAFDEPAQIH